MYSLSIHEGARRHEGGSANFELGNDVLCDALEIQKNCSNKEKLGYDVAYGFRACGGGPTRQKVRIPSEVVV
jgi:hypothetical protein